MDENRRRSALEQLEQEFESSKSIKEGSTKPPERERKRRTGNKKRNVLDKRKQWHILMTVIPALLLIVIAGIFLGVNKMNSSDVRNKYPSFITKEEKEDWKNKSVDKGQIYVYVNTSLDVKADGKSVALRLANPPYCAYPLKIKLSIDENKDTYLYQSELIKPGDSVEDAELTGLPAEKGVYNATIYYTFYEEKGETVVGEHQVKATIETHDQTEVQTEVMTQS